MDRYLQGALAVIAAVAVVRLLLFLFASPPFCIPRCILFVDYAPVIEKLDRSGDKQTVVLSNDIHIASNLLRLLPNTRVIVPTEVGGLDIGLAEPDGRNCYFIWFRTYRGSDEQSLESALRRTLGERPSERELAAIAPIEYVKVEWQTWLLRDWGPDTIIGVAKIDSASSLCRDRSTPKRFAAIVGGDREGAGALPGVTPRASPSSIDGHTIGSRSSR